MGKKAAVIGASGATGQHLVIKLYDSGGYERVQTFGRRLVGYQSSLVEEHLIDFDSSEKWADLIDADDIFLCLGTTLKTAGSKAAQYRVDFEYQYAFARFAREAGAKRIFVISSPGASPKAKGFYLRIKGELDEAVKKLGFETTVLIKPSLIRARREDERMGEVLGDRLLTPLCKLPGLRRYRPINAHELARAIAFIATQIDAPAAEYVLDDIQSVLPEGDLFLERNA
jgi:uncharacterized protein YbjT (DUF2867 family)